MFTLRVREMRCLLVDKNQKKIKKTETTYSGWIRPPKVSSRFLHTN